MKNVLGDLFHGVYLLYDRVRFYAVSFWHGDLLDCLTLLVFIFGLAVLMAGGILCFSLGWFTRLMGM